MNPAARGERVSPVEVVAGFIASEVGHWSPGMAEQARELIGALEAAGWQIVAGDAVVIPRSAIPRGATTVCVNEAYHCRWSGRPEEAEQWNALAALLSGATTEGDEG